MNLWLKDILELDLAKDTMQSAKNIINYFRSHQVLLAILQRLQKEKYGSHIALLLPGATRWGSAYYCLVNLLKTKVAIQNSIHEEFRIVEEINGQINNFEFWRNAKILCEFLEPFVKFINHLQSDQPRLSSVYIQLKSIENRILQNIEIAPDFKTHVLAFGKQRWTNFLFNPVVLLAYQLDPKYRGEILNADRCDPIIEREILRLVPEGKENQVLMEYSDYIGKLGGFSDDHLWGDITSQPINWWTLVARRYPLLSTIARQVLSIPSTSAASERNWSSFGFIHSKLRNRLGDDKVEKCVYLYWNMKILKQIRKKGNIFGNTDLEEIDNNNEIVREDNEEIAYELLENLNDLLSNE